MMPRRAATQATWGLALALVRGCMPARTGRPVAASPTGHADGDADDDNHAAPDATHLLQVLQGQQGLRRQLHFQELHMPQTTRLRLQLPQLMVLAHPTERQVPQEALWLA